MANRPYTRAQRLIDASYIVKSVLTELDTEQEACECCGLGKYRNYEEAKAFPVLEGIVRKLEKLAPVIDNPSDRGGHHDHRS